jgi:hypothetical protein
MVLEAGEIPVVRNPILAPLETRYGRSSHRSGEKGNREGGPRAGTGIRKTNIPSASTMKSKRPVDSALRSGSYSHSVKVTIWKSWDSLREIQTRPIACAAGHTDRASRTPGTTWRPPPYRVRPWPPRPNDGRGWERFATRRITPLAKNTAHERAMPDRVSDRGRPGSPNEAK